jgi:carbon monoxide dehydrogenase subunit G
MHLRIASGFALAALIAVQAGAAQTEVAVSRSDRKFVVHARTDVNADRETVWRVLTDYENYPAFVPGLRLSRIVHLQPRRVEQIGEFGVFFFRKDVRSMLEIQEWPSTRILFRSLGGDLKKLETEVTISGTGSQQTIRYSSEIEPDFWVPPLIGTSIVRISIRGKLQAVSEEIERRAAAISR